MRKTGDLIYIDNSAGKELTIWFDPNPNLAAKIKSVEGCRFDNDKMCWITNYTTNKLEELYSVFKDEMVILSSQLLLPFK